MLMMTNLPALRMTSPVSAATACLRSMAVGGLALMCAMAAHAEVSNGSTLGPGLRSRPAYDGAAAQRTEIVPVVRYFGEPVFVRSTQGVLEGGLRRALANGLHAGVQLAYEPGRKTSESTFLERHRIGDIDLGASVGLQLEWDHMIGPMPISLLARSRTHTRPALGTQADLRLSAGVFQRGRFDAGVFVQTIWADTGSTRSYYGLDAQASAAAGLPAYQPGGGLLSTSLGLLWSVHLGRRWVVVGSLESRRLQGDAARSPLVERQVNRYVSAGLGYSF